MRFESFFLLALSLFLAAAVPAHATEFHVTAGVGGNVFSPAALPEPGGAAVHPGDTITFTNPNAGFHNAHSSDPNFPFECGKGSSCTTGTPDQSQWSATVTVPDSAVGHTIAYICDIHGGFTEVGIAFGMTGTITVTAAPAPVELQSFDVE